MKSCIGCAFNGLKQCDCLKERIDPCFAKTEKKAELKQRYDDMIAYSEKDNKAWLRKEYRKFSGRLYE